MNPFIYVQENPIFFSTKNKKNKAAVFKGDWFVPIFLLAMAQEGAVFGFYFWLYLREVRGVRYLLGKEMSSGYGLGETRKDLVQGVYECMKGS